MKFTVGQIIAETYRLVSLLGQGAMGSVWRAETLDTGDALAIKLLKPSDPAKLAEATERFLREAKATTALRHPNIISVADYGVNAAIPYLCMEILEGESLSAWLKKKGRLSPTQALGIISQICAGLAEAHRAGIIHRDLKPDNVFVVGKEDEPHIKILDFGVAKTSQEFLPSATLTKTGALIGTPHYMSPEQARGQRSIDATTDLWALAVITYECLTGHRPFHGAGPGDLVISICVDTPDAPSSCAPVPKGFDEWFAKAVSKDKSGRFATTDEFLQALRAVAHEPLVGSDRGTQEAEAYDDETIGVQAESSMAVVALNVSDELALMQSLGGDFISLMEEFHNAVRRPLSAHGGLVLGTSNRLAVFSDSQEAVLAAVNVLEVAAQQVFLNRISVRISIAVHDARRLPGSTELVHEEIELVTELARLAHPGQAVATAGFVGRCGETKGEFGFRSLGALQIAATDIHHVEVSQIAGPGLGDDFPPLRGEGSAQHNLPPQPTRFIGRTQLVDRLAAHIRDNRLVTLVGPGGSGKSRIATQTAAALTDEFPDGIFFIPLASLVDPALVVSTMARVLGVQEEAKRALIDLISENLASQRCLLILDTFERVHEAKAQIAALSESCQSVHIMVTSRAVTKIPHEVVVDIPPMQLPPLSDDSDPAALLTNEAVALFVDRAQRATQTFGLDLKNSSAVAAIVRKLEGMPLALELAAVRLRLFEPQRLLHQLTAGRAELADASGQVAQRHSALTDVIAWSVDLLEPAEKTLLNRLSVFASGCDVAGATAVATSADVVDVEAGLYSLADKSLLRRTSTAFGPRFSMLDSIREFAADQLDTSGERAATMSRLLGLIEEWSLDAKPKLNRADATAVVDRLAHDKDTVLAVLHYCLESNRASEGIQIASRLWRLFQTLGLLRDGRRYIAEFLANSSVTLCDRCQALLALGGIAYWQADYAASEKAYEEALGLSRDLGDALAEGEATLSLGQVATWKGDFLRGEDLADEARDIFEGLGAREQVGTVTMAQGFALWMQGKLDQARPLWEESIEIAREIGDEIEACHKELALASISYAEGEQQQAIVDCIDAMDELYAHRHVAHTVMAIDWIASLSVAQEPEEAVRLAAAANALRGPLGGGMKPESCGLPNTKARATEVLGRDKVRKLWSEGRRLSLEGTVEIARTMRGTISETMM